MFCFPSRQRTLQRILGCPTACTEQASNGGQESSPNIDCKIRSELSERATQDYMISTTGAWQASFEINTRLTKRTLQIVSP